MEFYILAPVSQGADLQPSPPQEFEPMVSDLLIFFLFKHSTE